MSNYSSRMYGLKVKERVNYFPFGDSKGKVTLSYADGLWIIKAGDTTEEEAPANVEWWFNGTKFQNGETIITFNDGDVVTYNIMETHTDVTPYKNYIYDIYGGSAENINYGTEDISYKITPLDSTGRFYKSIKVYETKNGLISSDKVINSIDIVNNKRVYDKPLKAYNMLFDWIDNKFKIISDSNYINYNGNTVSKGLTIRIVEPDNFDEFEVTDETNKHYAKEVGKDAVPKITLCKRNGGRNIAVNTKDRNTIYSDVYHDHTKAYYNGKYHNAMYLVWDTTGAAGCWKKTIKDSLVMTYAHPYWFLMTTKDGVEYNGTTYLARKLIRTWKPETVVDMTLRRQKTRKLEKPVNGNFDKIIYDVYEYENSDSVTVKYQKVVSRTEYVDLDSVTFSSSAGNVLFHNIEFRCRNGKWTIYSKCGFITYGGRKYLKNKAILSFNVAEAIHININDESNKYVVDTVTTWRIRTPDSDITLDYAIHTSESAKTLKVVKTTNDEEEPWITVYYYEAIHQAYEVDDISFKYDIKKQEWELYSNSDKLYYNGENRKLGELLKTWSYHEIVKISGISVTHTDIDSIMVEKKETSTGGMISNNDIDEDIDWYNEEEPDLHISYAYSKNVWKITALRECFVSGTRYSESDIIATFKSKEPVSSFTVMVPHDDEGEIVNVLYSFDVSISIKGITTVHVDSHRYGEKAYTDKDVNSVANETMIFTTQDAKSMYGYIWKKSIPPGPVPTDIYDILFPIAYRIGYYYSNSIVGITRNLDAVENAFITSTTSWNNNIQYIGNYGTRIYFTGKFIYDGPISLLFADSFGNNWNEIDGFDGNGCVVIGMMNMTTAICTSGLNGRYYTKLQSYTVASSASKNFDNDISSIITNVSYISVVKAYSLNNVLLSVNFLEYIYNYSFESNSIIHDIKAEIQSDISAAEAQWNFTHVSPDGFIEQQRVMGYSVPNSTYCFELNGKVYMFIKHIYIHYHSGYIWGGEQQDYDVEDWGCCCYIVDQNGAGEIHKNVITPEDFENFVWWTDPYQDNYDRHGPFEYNGNYYFHYVDDNFNSIRIAMFDPVNITFTLVKTLTNSDSVLVRNLATGHYMNVYFDTRAYSVSDDWVGAMGFTSGSFATKGSHVMSSKADPNDSSRRYYIFFANPLLETNAGNFIIHDDTRISN